VLERNREVFNDALKGLDVIALIVDERNMSEGVGRIMLRADAYIPGGKPVAVSLCPRETLHELTSVASLIAEMYFLMRKITNKMH
jgi:hypothetical protein